MPVKANMRLYMIAKYSFISFRKIFQRFYIKTILLGQLGQLGKLLHVVIAVLLYSYLWTNWYSITLHLKYSYVFVNIFLVYERYQHNKAYIKKYPVNQYHSNTYDYDQHANELFVHKWPVSTNKQEHFNLITRFL